MPLKTPNRLELERQTLAGVTQYPEVFPDIDGIIKESFYSQKIHQVIFSIIKNNLLAGEPIDKFTISNKIINLNLSFEIDIYGYLEALEMIQINKDSILSYFKELGKIHGKEQIYKQTEEIQKYLNNSNNDSFTDVVSKCDHLYGDTINSFENNEKPVEVFQNLESFIEEIGNNPVNESGIVSPYPIYNKKFSGFRNGEIYCWCSRAGQGKSTILTDISYQLPIINQEKNVKVLYLDTEIPTRDAMIKITAALSGVDFWMLDTGNFRKEPESYKKVKLAWEKIKSNKYNLYHKQVGNLNIQNLLSLIRRWYLNECGRENQPVIVYDYLKILASDRDSSYAEWILIGDKMMALKDIATEIGAPLLTAIQLNRSGVNTNRPGSEIIDDETAISGSDRIMWFGCFVAIFRRKTLDEIADDGPQFGSHKQIVLKARYQGRESYGHHDYIKTLKDGKTIYKSDFINYNISNFAIQERGTLKDIARANSMQLIETKKKPVEKLF